MAKAANSETARKLDDATAQNTLLLSELATLKQNGVGVGGGGGQEADLKRELQDTLNDFEELTKASVEAEKERDDLELQLDQLKDRAAELENRLAEEQVKWLGMTQPTSGFSSGNSPGGSGQVVVQQSTSALVLKNEFKKMMRETRTEHMRVLRAEQDERKRLEAMIRTLKKGSTGKSNLNYSMTA